MAAPYCDENASAAIKRAFKAPSAFAAMRILREAFPNEHAEACEEGATPWGAVERPKTA